MPSRLGCRAESDSTLRAQQIRLGLRWYRKPERGIVLRVVLAEDSARDQRALHLSHFDLVAVTLGVRYAICIKHEKLRALSCVIFRAPPPAVSIRSRDRDRKGD